MTGPATAYLWVALGGALGSMARYGAARLAARLIDGTFPWSTMFVNVLGSLLIGFLAGVMSPDGRFTVAPDARAFLLIGVLGGFTTFSSFSLETLNMLRDGEWLWAGANVAGSILLCIMAVWLGHAAAVALPR